MSVKFNWESSYSVGDKLLDEQHKKIFYLGNEISNMNGLNVKKVVMDLFKHTREHFDHEEELMQEVQFPGFEEHRELHNDLIEKLGATNHRSSNTDHSNVYIFRKLVYDWIIDHIMTQDKIFFNYYRQAKNK
ncbi:MAG: bacteriohemerythrin [Candidatus Scalinduaceae bacterium]